MGRGGRGPRRRMHRAVIGGCGCESDFELGFFPQGGGQAELGQRKNEPLRWIEIIPPRSVPIIARVGVMVIMVAFPEGQHGDPPAIPTRIG